ncbi:hypothetical protein ACUTR7_00455 [Delftia sp. NA_296.1]|uniref:hypothetical protein n=1 Tax=Delftia sp. NA_296.1 TaxID=3415648 RepID=UPI0040466EC9
MSDTPKVLRIVPGQRDSTGAHAAMGTRIFCGDQEVSHVTKLTLVAEVGGIWKAAIECAVIPPEVDALHEGEVNVVEVTDLSDEVRSFIRAAVAGTEPTINVSLQSSKKS